MISLVLLPDAVDSQLIVDFSRRLANSQFTLGADVLPHITVAMFDAPRDEAESLWQEVQPILGSPFSLVSGGAGFILDRRGGQVWVELQFNGSQRLTELQSAVLQTDFGKSHPVLNATAEAYRPHCTLGLVVGGSTSQLALADAPVLQRVFENMRLAVGINGEYFAFTQALFQQDI